MNFESEILIKEIENYINDGIYDYAIMINGPWGCGKSYFIHNAVIDYIKELRPYVYISLNGVKNLQEINKQIYVQNYFGNKKGKNIMEITSFASSIAFDMFEKKGINLDRIRLTGKFIKNKISLKSNTILIFDDLERSKISIKEILGYINNFVEQQKLKVIVVANENEIIRNFKNTEEDKENNLYDGKIDANSKKLQPLDNESEYMRIKEKMFGETFNYVPNLEKSCEEILNKLKPKVNENSYRIKQISEKVPEICKIMISCNHMNLRTFQFYLSKMMTLGKKLYVEISNENKELFNNYLTFSFEECVYYKLGEEKSEEEKEEMDFIKNLLFQYIRGELFLDDKIIDEIEINYFYMRVDAEINKKVSDFFSWATKNAKITKDNFEYLSKNAHLIDISILGKILINCARLQRMNVLSKDKIREFLKNVRKNSELNSEKNIRMIERHKNFLDDKNTKEIFMEYIPLLKSVENLDFYNPFSDWIEDKIEKYIIFNEFSVVDREYLSEEIIEKISKSIKNKTSAETIWYLRDLLSKVFSEYNIGNIFQSTLENNLCKLKKLSDNIDEMLDNEFNDPIIKNAVYRLNCKLRKIYSSCRENRT